VTAFHELWRRGAGLLAIAATLSALSAITCAQSDHSPPPPRLVVVIVVDQMCHHHVDRFRDLYSGGFDRLLSGGAVFTNAWHDHARTHTSPGHASIATGSHPGHHGIVANAWYDRTNEFASTWSAHDEEAHLVGQPDRDGASPRQLLCDAMGDRLKKQSADSQVFSVALKNYASVLMGGRRPDAAYWYDAETGTYCSSTWYMDEYPAWVEAFNAGRPADVYRGAVWTKSHAASAYERSRPDEFEAESDGEHTTFPYPVETTAGKLEESFYGFLRSTPFADELTLRFAAGIVVEENLGMDDAPDVLFVGCSAADFIGHTWGPYSQEAQDYYLRLDGYLATFLDVLDDRVGPGRYVVALTSDHGVDPLPEELAGKIDGARRINRGRYYEDLDRVADNLAREYGFSTPLIVHRNRGLVLDPAASAESGFSQSELRGRLASEIRKFPYVEDVFTYDELDEGSISVAGDARPRRWNFYRLYRNGFHPDRSPDLYVLFKEHRLLTGGSTGTTHGSPHPYDRRVPLVFMGPGVTGGVYDGEVHTTDVAPTLESLLGISARETDGAIDGRVLEQALTGSARKDD
jgi:predicted AlkP superfamily pyrophosphatase or phosphodiesterase